MNSANEFGRLYESVCALERAGFAAPAALATVTRTAGSTFRHAGASMLIHAGGDVVCALSGGCPQRDIVQRAQRVISDNTPAIASYNRNSSLDVLLEMGCGGEIEVLIEPLRDARDIAFVHALAQLQARRETGFMATAFARDGAVLAPRPRRLVRGSQLLWSDLDDTGLAEHALALAQTASRTATLVQRVAGAVDVLLEFLQPPLLLLLVGVNEVALALAAVGASLGWKCVLVDNAAAPWGIVAARAPAATALSADPRELRELRERVACDSRCAAVVMTFNIERDLAYLAELASLPLGYLGAIGSRERSARMRAALGPAGARLHAPAGLDIGAESPQEIALAIAAQIMAQQREHAGSNRGAAPAPPDVRQ